MERTHTNAIHPLLLGAGAGRTPRVWDGDRRAERTRARRRRLAGLALFRPTRFWLTRRQTASRHSPSALQQRSPGSGQA